MPPDPLETSFRRPVLVWLVAAAACSLALALVLVIVRPEAGQVGSSGADAFSRSALGHRGFVDLLRAEGVPVVVSRYASASRASDTAVLVVAEPHLDGAHSSRGQKLAGMIESVDTVLLVLPKWTGREDPQVPGWIDSAELMGSETVGQVLRAAKVEASVVRPATAGACQGTAVPAEWTAPQLLRSDAVSFHPLISCPGGILLGEVESPEGPRILVLSDPDPISNHGLGRGDNARLALEIVGRARTPGQAVVVDETLHGHERIPSLWREMFAFPLLPSVVQAGLALLALVWSGMGRFGAPLPSPAARASGKDALIENTASLLRLAGHSAHTLGRYLEATVGDVGSALHAPAFSRPGELRAWLHALGRRRGSRVDLRALEEQVGHVQEAGARTAEPVVAAARRIHRWKQEMLRGPEGYSGR
ncbi:MAG TPA: DUF4350 domain-containing protein [Vicinamibacteria bacterium]|nr:DUF4350 domain-containing protein [Vicinamibacteria bacterium]